ncbi:hypothetical protein KP509_05G006800 [Ceratopteris richardii]|uniref:Protease Do-like 1, chloroplastic n=1 Tax=Ceratopteris richardii TaxID=49495 RepID=A0A8T2UL75_CERRI|nr:hypothetical protein KP509_05G006800 [Ceratopteris richardii]
MADSLHFRSPLSSACITFPIVTRRTRISSSLVEDPVCFRFTATTADIYASRKLSTFFQSNPPIGYSLTGRSSSFCAPQRSLTSLHTSSADYPHSLKTFPFSSRIKAIEEHLPCRENVICHSAEVFNDITTDSKQAVALQPMQSSFLTTIYQLPRKDTFPGSATRNIRNLCIAVSQLIGGIGASCSEDFRSRIAELCTTGEKSLPELVLSRLTSVIVAFALMATVNADCHAFVVTSNKRLQGDELATVQLFQENTPSVVYITNLAARRDVFTLDITEVPQGSGSGFIWDRDGHIVTNYHVIRGASDLRVTLGDQSMYDAKVIGFDRDKDVAVLQIDAPKSLLRPIPVGSSADLLVGQKVYAIGNPFGLDHTLTTGVISGLRREISSASTGRPIQDVIQTDAAINPGNSGGPLLDSSGNLIGINTAIYSPSGASAGVGFSIPVDTVSSRIKIHCI